MLHPLARAEIRKLEMHGVTALTYDEVATLQSAAMAVDDAAASEGLPTGAVRPVRLTPTVVLWPLTLAAMAHLPKVTAWLPEDLQASGTAWLLAFGRDIPYLEVSTTDRATMVRTVKAWRNGLTVAPAELAAAVDAVFEAEDLPLAEARRNAIDSAADAAEAVGAVALADMLRRFAESFDETENFRMQKARARPDWGAVSARLAAITGCGPGEWAVQPYAAAIDAYAARFDFEAMRAGAESGVYVDRSQKSALRALFRVSGDIAKAHARRPKEGEDGKRTDDEGV